MLAVGHGNNGRGTFDPGASNPTNRWNEQTAGDHVVGAAELVLRATGAEVLSEARTDDGNWAWTAERANAWGADVVIAWHHDWYQGVDGGHGFWWPGSDDGQQLVRAVMAGHEAAGFPVRWDWVKARDDLGLLRQTHAPTALIECGRIGDKALDSAEELQTLGRAHGLAIAHHLGLTPDTSKEQDMEWLKKWPRYFRAKAQELADRKIITEHTDPNRPVGEVPYGEYLIARDRHLREVVRTGGHDR